MIPIKTLITLVFGLLLAHHAQAGTLDAPAVPNNTLSAKPVSGVGEPGGSPAAAANHALNAQMDKAPAVDNAAGAGINDVLQGKTFFGLTSNQWGTHTGAAPPGSNVQGANGALGIHIPNGLYSGNDKKATARDTNLIPTNIKKGTAIFGVAGAPTVIDTAIATPANARQVLQGKKTFVNGEELTGAMPNIGQQILIPGARAQAIREGYHNGFGQVTGDLDLKADNIKAGVTIFGVTGASAMVDTTTAAPANANEVLQGKQAFVNGKALIGAMPNVGQQNIRPGTNAQAIKAGYHNGTGQVTGDGALKAGNIKAGATIFGVAGAAAVVDTTTTAPANAHEVLQGKQAFVNGGALTGAMPNIGQQNIRPGTHAQAIKAGYHNGAGQVAGDGALKADNIKAGATIFGVAGASAVVDTTTIAPADANEVLQGKQAFVNGKVFAGTMPNIGQQNIRPGASAQAIKAGYHNGKGQVTGDPALKAGNIKAGVSIFGIPGASAVVDTATATPASAAEVLQGKQVFANGKALVGAMPNIGQQNITPGTSAQAIKAGYHNGAGQVAGDSALKASNIKAGVSIFGVTGNQYGGCNCASGTLMGTRWCNNNDGTITDLLGDITNNNKGRCLVWLRNANCDATLWNIKKTGALTWNNAIIWSSALFSGICGLTDRSSTAEWRLPTRTELDGITNGTDAVSSGNMHAFLDVQPGAYWSSTTGINGVNNAWYVHLSDGFPYFTAKSNRFYVWPVRDGQ